FLEHALVIVRIVSAVFAEGAADTFEVDQAEGASGIDDHGGGEPCGGDDSGDRAVCGSDYGEGVGSGAGDIEILAIGREGDADGLATQRAFRISGDADGGGRERGGIE